MGSPLIWVHTICGVCGHDLQAVKIGHTRLPRWKVSTHGPRNRPCPGSGRLVGPTKVKEKIVERPPYVYGVYCNEDFMEGRGRIVLDSLWWNYADAVAEANRHPPLSVGGGRATPFRDHEELRRIRPGQFEGECFGWDCWDCYHGMGEWQIKRHEVQ